MGRQRSCTNLWRRYPPNPAETGGASGYMPLLFSLYMLPLSQIMRKNQIAYHSYADDTQIYLALSPNDYSPIDSLCQWVPPSLCFYCCEWLFHFLLCKALWITTVYEMCYINKLALPCLAYISGRFAIGSSDFFSFSDDDFVYTDPEAYSPLTRLAVGPSVLDLLGWSAFYAPQHHSSSGPVRCRYLAIISRKSLKEQIGVLRWRSQRWSMFPAWGNPMRMPRSLVLIVLTARASVSPLCARASLSFQRAIPPLAPSRFLPPRDLWGKNSGAEVLSARLRASSRRLRSRVPRFRHTERCLPSFFPNLTSVPLQAWAIWSHSGEVTMSWPMTACHW